MENQGIVLGTTLGLKNFNNRLLVQSVGTQAVDGFRGDCHQTALFDDVCRNLRGFRGSGRKKKCFHS